MARRHTAIRRAPRRPAIRLHAGEPPVSIMASTNVGTTQSVVNYRLSGLRSCSSARSQSYEKPSTTRLEDIARVRTEYGKNGLLQRIIGAEVDNIVGTGFRVVHRTPDREWNVLAADYLKWRNSSARFAFPNLPGRSEHGVHTMACFHQVLDGGCLIYRSARGVELFDEVQCQTPWQRWNDPTCRDGLQFGSDGRLQGFWVGPYSELDGRVSETDMLLIPAFADMPDGEQFAVTTYLHGGRFSSAYRASAPLACILDDLERFGDYYDAITERAISEAMVVGVHETDNKNAAAGFKTGRKDGTTDSAIDAAYTNPAYLEPNSIVRTRPGDKFDIKSITSPGSQFEPYVKMSTRLIAAPANMPIEVALMFFADTNFAASKAAMEQFRIACRATKQTHAQEFTANNTELLLYEGMRDGDLPWNDDWRRFQVIPSGWRSLSELDEAQAMEIRAGSVTSATWEMQETFGRTPDDRVEDLSTEEEAIREGAARLGIPVEDMRARFYSNPFKKATMTTDPSNAADPAAKRLLNNKA